MNCVSTFGPPEVTDEDIRWASRLLGLPENAFYGENCTDPRQAVLKSMKTIDVAACPGSGKTTLLVAKLAILAEKWRYRTRGICVLSHTNAARYEIESRLGNTTAGRRLLSYPHFIGTIHAFVNEFFSLPWLRSQDYPITMIDTEISLRRRWNDLPYTTRIVLERNRHEHSVLTIRSSDFGVGDVRWGKNGFLGTDTPTYGELRNACRKSCLEGYFCYDEMFMWANNLMNKVSDLVDMIHDRFPLLFIDEAQDNSEVQSAILHRVFLEGGSTVIRQRLGDPNQAIFNFVGASGAETDVFQSGATMDLPNSHRFGQKIADLADLLGLRPYGMRGQGPKKYLTSGKEGKHTIFFFDNDSAKEVLKAYAELLIETFSEKELREGNFTAVGMIHRPPEKEEAHKFPRHVGHYWHNYDPVLARQDPKPQTFVQYVFAGQGKAEESGEAYLVVEKIAEGILRLTGMAQGATSLRRRKYSHRYVMGLLEENAETRNRYEELVAEFAAKRNVLTKGKWDGRWREVVRQIAETIAGSALVEGGNDFLKWEDTAGISSSPPDIRSSCNNVYHYPIDNPNVHIRVGSIHSVKGETHTATLVFETFWRDNKRRHNLELLLPWLNGDKSGGASIGKLQNVRLKLHYVAMTRPTHLLCLAMKRSTFETELGIIDNDVIKALRQRGWQIKLVCQDEYSESGQDSNT